MPALCEPLRGGGRRRPGGALGYPAGRLLEEVAYLAYYFHWPYTQVMSLDHPERRRWAQELARMNERINAAVRGDSIEQ